MTSSIRLFQTVRDLVALESITGSEEPVVEYLERELNEMGLVVRSEVIAAGRRNLYAGPERPAVLFCTHTDTVPPFLPPREDSEYIYGRGACDTKGIQACMLAAGRKLLAAGNQDFGYLFVVGEEVDNIGARTANRSVRCGHVIVGEPTDNRVAVGHKGVLALRVQVAGVAAHSAYPDKGDSAVHRLVAALHRLQSTDFGNSDVLGPASVNIGTVRGGVAPNVFAPSAEATVVVRVVEDIDATETRVRECFRDPLTGEEDPNVELEILSRMKIPRLERVEGFPETVVSFGTDVPFLEDVGKAVLFGPGSILDAHTDGEKVEKAALIQAVDDYVGIARRVSGAESRGGER